ncbi:MAG: ATP-dependent Clp protease proteolytic subunit [Chitinophagales bacterium]|jgi:ATP-dependent Clp protease protease subunit|nr:ATP-dependent Clp protease proteolytic subunit [Chitinophagales bacterium]HNL07688.1 ATP-dependent Clp protease proteolytic subunit [Chitinophagales bacterium]
MQFSKEFRDFAVKHEGINSLHVDKYIQNVSNGTRFSSPSSLYTPNVIEERPMNATAIDVFSRLMMDRIIFLGSPIEAAVGDIIVAQLLFLESTDPQRDIQVYINSPGGSVISGLAIYDTMQYVRPDIAILCTGFSASMAAVLLSAGTKGKRACLQHSRVMIHQPMGGAQGQVSDIEISYRLIKDMQSELYEILSKHTGQDYDKVAHDCDRDYWMRAQEAKEYGIVDEVLSRS